MSSGVQFSRDWGVVATSDVMEVLCELFWQVMPSLANVQGTTERAGDDMNIIVGDKSKGDCDTEMTGTGSCYNPDIRNIGASSAVGLGPGVGTRLGERSRD